MDKRISIGLTGIADFRSNIGQDLIRGVLTAAIDNHIHVINCCSSIKYSLSDDMNLYNYYRTYFSYMNKKNISGLITWASSLSCFMSTQEIKTLHASLGNMPMVALGIPILENIPGVYTNNDYDIGLILDHLIKVRKYKRVAFYASTNRIQYVSRLEAYKKWHKNNNVDLDEKLIFLTEHFERTDVVTLVDQIVSQGANIPPLSLDAIITVSDIVAGYIINELESRGFHVPQDIAVTGFNNQIESMTATVPITTVDLCFYKRGYRAVELLLESIAAQKTGTKIHSVYFPSQLVVRQSCGSFENLITSAKYAAEQLSITKTIEAEPHTDEVLTSTLIDGLSKQISNIDLQYREAFARAIASDYSKKTETASLIFLRKILNQINERRESITQEWNYIITIVRELVLLFAEKEQDTLQMQRMENIFHQARILISLMESYYISSMRHDAYQMSSIGQIAIDFASAITINEILEKISFHLDELKMKSLHLVLQNEMTPTLEEGKLIFSHPTKRDELENEKSIFLSAGVLPLKQIADKGKNIQIMRLLYFKNNYLGYALIGMGPDNMALYDMLQALLTRSLYAIYLRQGYVRNEHDTQILLRTKEMQGILAYSSQQTKKTGKLTPTIILEYLASHLNEATNLDVISSDIGISKSHLMRQVKRITGYSIQVLHEMLKIERAVILLDRQEDATIGEIAERLGFKNQSYFAKVFKSHKGLSPLAWKKQTKTL